MIFTSINANIHRITFWVVAYLAFDPSLLNSIRAETLPGITHDVPDVKYLTEECPHLQALVNEVLRLHMGSALMRHVVAPTVMGGKTLRAGRKIIVELPFPPS